MNRIPRKYNTEERETIIKLTSRCDKLGNSIYMVEFGDDYVAFTHMSSALDFIQTNFRK